MIHRAHKLAFDGPIRVVSWKMNRIRTIAGLRRQIVHDICVGMAVGGYADVALRVDKRKLLKRPGSHSVVTAENEVLGFPRQTGFGQQSAEKGDFGKRHLDFPGA